MSAGGFVQLSHIIIIYMVVDIDKILIQFEVVRRKALVDFISNDPYIYIYIYIYMNPALHVCTYPRVIFEFRNSYNGQVPKS